VGGRASRKPSRFLDGLWPEEGAARRPAARAPRRDRIAELAESDPEGAALVERLRAWRRQVATAIGKPPYTVLHDTTLAAIAEAKPKDLRQLGILRGVGAAKLEA